MQAEREDGRTDNIGNSEPRSNNFAKWAYNDPNYSGNQDVNYALAMAAGPDVATRTESWELAQKDAA